MSGLNKIFHKSMWFLEHMENPRSSCGRSGRSWSHGTDSLDNQCWHKASQAAGGAERSCAYISLGAHRTADMLSTAVCFNQVFMFCTFFLQGNVSLTSLPYVMLQVQLQFPWGLETPGNLETEFFFSDFVEAWWNLVSFWPTYVKSKRSPQDTWSLHSSHWTETCFSDVSHCVWQDQSMAWAWYLTLWYDRQQLDNTRTTAKIAAYNCAATDDTHCLSSNHKAGAPWTFEIFIVSLYY